MALITKDKLTQVFNNVNKKADAAGFKTAVTDATSNLTNKANSAISGVANVGTSSEGIKSLTSGLSGQGISQLTESVAGLDLLTPIATGEDDITKITGKTAASGFNFAFSGGSGTEAIAGMMQSAQTTLSTLTGAVSGGLSALAATLSKISGGNFSTGNILGELAKSASTIVSTAQGSLLGKLDGLTNAGIGFPVKDLIEKTTNNIGGPLSRIINNQGSLKPDQIKNIVGQVDAGNILDPSKLLATKIKDSTSLVDSLDALGNKNIKNLTDVEKEALAIRMDETPGLKEEFIESTLDDIETSAAKNVDTALPSTKAMGKSTTPTQNIGDNEAQWDGDKTKIDYEFSTVTSYEELESEFRSAERDITEVIVNWTESFTDEDFTVREVFEEMQSRKANIACHYLILKDGSIGRMAPIGTKTAHTKFGGWKADRSTIKVDNGLSHLIFSIGISFVGGLNVSAGDLQTLREGNQEDIIDEANPIAGGGIDDLTEFRDGTSYVNLQNNSFDAFMKTFYTVFPGAQAWGLNDLAPNHDGPGFSVPDYTKQRFNKVNIRKPIDEALSAKRLKATMIADMKEKIEAGAS